MNDKAGKRKGGACWYCGHKTRRIDESTYAPGQQPDYSCCPSHDDPA